MEETMSRILVGTFVKRMLKEIRESPERNTRNLVDMALQFSRGRFQQHFFGAAQTMLQKEDSGYYALVRDTVAWADLDRLYTFGMNLKLPITGTWWDFVIVLVLMLLSFSIILLVFRKRKML